MIRVLIVSEIRLYRDGLTDILGRHPEIDVAASAGEWSAAFEATTSLHPDIVLLDMALADCHAVLERIQDLEPRSKVIALGVKEVEGEVITWAEAGIAGYVPREGTLDTLIDAIQAAVHGELHCTPLIAGCMLRRIAALSANLVKESDVASLTAREGEILRLIDEGYGNKDIARRLGIEVATVKNHVHNLLDKLRVQRRGQAAAKARSLASNRRI